MDFQAEGAALHAAREMLQGQQDAAGFSDSDVEKLADGIARGVDDFLTEHQDSEFMLEQVTDAVESRLRYLGLLEPRASEVQLDAIQAAIAAATQSGVETLNQA